MLMTLPVLKVLSIYVKNSLVENLFQLLDKLYIGCTGAHRAKIFQQQKNIIISNFSFIFCPTMIKGPK